MDIGYRRLLAGALTAVALGAGALVAPSPAAAAPACPVNPTTRVAPRAIAAALRDSCTQAQFDRLFSRADAGPIPRGALHGQARPVGAPDAAASAAIAAIWSGKTFHRGWLANRALGGQILPADVYYARSVIDGRRVIRIDYRRSGLPFAHDELRRLPNGVYLGYGFLGATKAVDFWVWK
ncbi:hypothetical protein GOHSU_25_00590 [Gordonia hirsuta DSM 44140 = NBRC 16056]|uniref:Uncharacterized protein n=1 Tax=Gordonia hirsuta DSM 44140 = NBRC 16056 TaxID=1121927 RepID=L7LA70_9ACTN|nr:hypothetical protein [Gordonia hirsuta]GAC57824.1 hypothetical protein GOHSU_25_00590 [Gordonia hirsuta DSM 44140 = NBRC 16056]